MPQFLLLVVIALVVAALVFGIGALLTGSDPGLVPADPDGASRGLPGHRPLLEDDLKTVRFDTGWRGYRMSQVDAALARAAYDIGFKQEMIEALRSEVAALREGRTEDAEVLRKAREAATGGAGPQPPDAPAGPAPDARAGLAPDEMAGRGEPAPGAEAETAGPAPVEAESAKHPE